MLAVSPSQQLMTGLLCGRQELPSGPQAEGGVLHITLYANTRQVLAPYLANTLHILKDSDTDLTIVLLCKPLISNALWTVVK